MGARWLHRHIEGADWYYICAPTGTGFSGTLDFRNTGQAEIWDPVTGSVTPAVAIHNGERTEVTLRLPQAGSCFVVFRKDSDITVPSAKTDTITSAQHSLDDKFPRRVGYTRNTGSE